MEPSEIRKAWFKRQIKKFLLAALEDTSRSSQSCTSHKRTLLFFPLLAWRMGNMRYTISDSQYFTSRGVLVQYTYQSQILTCLPQVIHRIHVYYTYLKPIYKEISSSMTQSAFEIPRHNRDSICKPFKKYQKCMQKGP